MKLQFKHQQYQADAAQSAVRCFEGQSKGFRKEVKGGFRVRPGIWNV